MGAWGTGVFDNDTACDWTYELEKSRNLAVVEAALDKVLSRGDEVVDASDAEEALAAAEVVARLLGRWGERNSYTRTADTWVTRMARLRPSRALTRKALDAIDRILGAPGELQEAWNTPELLERWRAGVLELRGRIEDGGSAAAEGTPTSGKPWWKFW